MSSLMTVLSDKEVEEFTDKGTCNYYYLALCGAGWDSGTCINIYKACGYRPGGGSAGCSTGAGCTCR